MTQAVTQATPGLAEQDFRAAMRHFPTAVTVLTVTTATGPVGMTAGTVTRVSAEPELLSVCLRRDSRLAAAVAEQGGFAVNLLQSHQTEIARWFASPARFGAADEFGGVAWYPAPGEGHPLLADAACVLGCRTAAVIPGGDHVVVIGRVLLCRLSPSARPLISYRGQFHTLDGPPTGGGAPVGGQAKISSS